MPSAIMSSMGGLRDSSSRMSSRWEPEPLHLPVSIDGRDGRDGWSDDGPHRHGNRNHGRNHQGHGRDDDLPGSHVIVIDVA